MPKRKKSLGKSARDQWSQFSHWCQSQWKKAPREWMAVGAVVVLILVGVFYNATQTGDQFRGQFADYGDDVNNETGLTGIPYGDDYFTGDTQDDLGTLNNYGCSPGWDPATNCQTCLSNYELVGGKCLIKCTEGTRQADGSCSGGTTKTVTCEDWQQFDSSGEKCIDKCLPDRVWDGTQCVDCASGKKTDDNKCVPESTSKCAADEVYVVGRGCLKQTSPGEVDIFFKKEQCNQQGMDYDMQNDKCIPYSIDPSYIPVVPGPVVFDPSAACKSWQQLDANNLCVDKCKFNRIWDGTQCVECGNDKVKTADNKCEPKTQVACKEWEQPGVDGTCIDKCLPGRIWDTTAITPRCVDCPSGQKTADNKCVPVTNPEPTCKTWQRNTNGTCSDICPTNAIWDGARCIACSSGSRTDNTCDTAAAVKVELTKPANNSAVFKHYLVNGSQDFSWKAVNDAVLYRYVLKDSAGKDVIDVTTKNVYARPVVDVDKYVDDTRNWTWQVAARMSDGTWHWSQTWGFDVVEATVPEYTDIDIDLDLSVDSYGEVDARIKVMNTGSIAFSSDNVIFRIENLTDRLDAVDYYYDRNGNPVFKISNLRKGDSPEVFDIDNLPNTGARGDKLFEVTMFDGNKIVAVDRDTVDYDSSNYDPYRPRPYYPKYGPVGRQVEIRGFVEEYKAKYVLVDENNRLIAYLVEFNDLDLENHKGKAVAVSAYVDFYSCEGSTLAVTDIRRLRNGETITNSLEDLHRAGAICYNDIDTRPVYDPVTGNITIIVDGDNPWYLPFVIDMFERGIMKGDRTGTLDPARNIAIAEVTKMATLSARISVLDEFYCIERGEPWYCNVMALAADRGWLSRGALSDPGRLANRAEVVELIMKAFGRSPEYTGKSFPDVDYANRDSGWIEGARRAGVIHGYPDGTFRPYQPINRAEVAKIYSNAIRIFGEGRPPVSNR